MSNKISTLALLLFVCSFSSWANPEYFEYDFTNNDKIGKTTLRFSNASIDKFPGWKHSRTRTASISMWYPSLADAASPNVWISTKEEQEKSKIKPKPEDRKINLSVGGINGNDIVDPNVTLGKKIKYSCRVKGSSKQYLKDGSKGIFNRYKYAEKNRPKSKPYYLYHPKKKISGIHCIKCNGATCQLFGITDFGINYVATENYIKGRMANEVIELHRGINQFLEKKIVK